MSQTFEEFLTTSSTQIPPFEFVINLLLTFLLAYILGYVYVKFGKTLSNRRAFARNFIAITMTTMLIITIVKSSLALSLGLVGALSIVRFRTAIKEPEELAFLFLCIAIGLGLGANQLLITLIAFVIIVSVLMLRSFSVKQEAHQNLLLMVSTQSPDKMALSDLVETLQQHCVAAQLKRFDETQERLEANFSVEFKDFAQLNEAKLALQQLSDSTQISFLDNTTGVF